LSIRIPGIECPLSESGGSLANNHSKTHIKIELFDEIEDAKK
jgi:hypothetical protein